MDEDQMTVSYITISQSGDTAHRTMTGMWWVKEYQVGRAESR